MKPPMKEKGEKEDRWSLIKGEGGGGQINGVTDEEAGN